MTDAPAPDDRERVDASDPATSQNDPGDATGADTSDSDRDAVRRRWLLRALVGLGIGLPIAIEARTFLGLFRAHVLGADDGTDATPTPTPTDTETAGVGVGDELLPETTPAETVRESQIRVRDADWYYELVVAVENTGESPYELRLGDLRTVTGQTVDGGGSTGQIDPGEQGVVEETWALPSNERPESVSVTTLTYSDEGTDLRERTVHLERPPLRGQN